MALQLLPPIPGIYDPCKLASPLSYSKFLPSIMQAPDLKLKPLPDHLKYVYLGTNKTLPFIITKELTSLQEEKLTKVLKDHKTDIGWTIADIKGISPSICIHKIRLKEGYKNSIEQQRRLNPIMKEVKKEIIKWLDANIIYPLSDRL